MQFFPTLFLTGKSQANIKAQGSKAANTADQDLFAALLTNLGKSNCTAKANHSSGIASMDISAGLTKADVLSNRIISGKISDAGRIISGKISDQGKLNEPAGLTSLSKTVNEISPSKAAGLVQLAEKSLGNKLEKLTTVAKQAQEAPKAQRGKVAKAAGIKPVKYPPSPMEGGDFILSGLVLAKTADTKITDLDILDQVKQLKVTKEDFADMKDALLNMGFSNKDVEQIEEMLSGDGGITWNAFLDQLSGMIAQFKAFAPVELDVEQALNLQNLFQEMGFTPQQSDSLMKDLSQGRVDKVWTALNQQMTSLPKETLDIKPEQIQALSQALKLPEESQNRVLQLFSKLEEGGFSKEELQALADTIKQESANQRQALENNLSEVRKSLGQTLNQALTKASDEKSNQEQIKWIKTQAEEATDKSTLEKAVERVSKETGDKENSYQNAKDKNQNEKGLSNDSWNNPGQNAKGKDLSNERLSSAAEENPVQSAKAGNLEELAWRQLLEKISVQGGSVAEVNPFDSAVPTTTKANFSPQQVFQQVQSGILRNLGNGTKQLTLQLDPPELGHVQVTISVSNKEVRAIIRPENQDAGKIITEQIQQIREVLEQQGLRVQKLEVQTQMPGDRGTNNWNGANDHNLTQEQREQVEKSSYFRKLSGKTDEVVQEMQNQATSATLTPGGLYIIA